MAASMSERIVLKMFNKRRLMVGRVKCREFGRTNLIQINAGLAKMVGEAVFPAIVGFNPVARA